ncbi:MAG: hypothetical protein ACE5MH_10345 [Terriglobia bacterium]
MAVISASELRAGIAIRLGLTIHVPQFITPGELVRVEVETGTYLERAKSEKKK